MTEQTLLENLILPDWPAPRSIRAVATTRLGGCSPPPYDSLNLGARGDDEPDHVAANRLKLRQALQLPGEPLWLRQVHGAAVVNAGHVAAGIEADAAWTDAPGQVCVVMMADCLPVLFCNRAGSRVAAAHAGWRGLVNGVIAATVEKLHCKPADLLAWLGPAIGPDAFEVGAEVRAAFLARDSANAACFRPSPAGRWLADVYALARRQLHLLGVSEIYGGGWCTLTERDRFFSYRRDGNTGRMAGLIWLE